MESEDCRAVAQRRRASIINCCSELRLGGPAEFHVLRSKDEGCRVVAHGRKDGLIRRHECGLRLGNRKIPDGAGGGELLALSARQFGDFSRRLQVEFQRFDEPGINYRHNNIIAPLTKSAVE